MTQGTLGDAACGARASIGAAACLHGPVCGVAGFNPRRRLSGRCRCISSERLSVLIVSEDSKRRSRLWGYAGQKDCGRARGDVFRISCFFGESQRAKGHGICSSFYGTPVVVWKRKNSASLQLKYARDEAKQRPVFKCSADAQVEEEPTPFYSSEPSQWTLSHPISKEWGWRKSRMERLRRRIRWPATDYGARILIKKHREYQLVLKRQGKDKSVENWIRRTPKQMEEYHEQGGYLPFPVRYKMHVEGAIATVRKLSCLREGAYDMREVMAPFCGRLKFRELCTVLKWVESWREAREFFAWMKLQLSYVPNVIVYTMLIKVYAKHKKIHLAEAAFQEMLDNRIEPDEIAFFTIVQMYADEQMCEEMLITYEAMMARNVLPSTGIYTTMLVALSRSARHSDANVLMEDMMESAVQPNDLTYALMINIYRKQEMFEEAVKVFEAMANAGYRPDETTYSMVLHMLGKLQRYSEAAKLFSIMQDLDVGPSKYTYATMLSICDETNNFELAASIFSDMQNKKHCPIDEVVYAIVINIYGKVGLYDEAEKLFGEMGRVGLLADVKTFCIMGNVRMKAGNYKLAAEAMEEVLRRGFALDDIAWFNLLRCYVRVGDVERATKTFRSLLSFGKVDLMMFNEMLNLYAEATLLEEAKWLGQQLQELSIKPDEVWFGTMMKLYCKANDVVAAEKIMKEMRKYGLSSNHIIQGTLIHAYAEAGRKEDALALLDRPGDKEDENGASLHSKISTCLKFQMFDKASLILDQLLQLSPFPLDFTSCNRLLAGFAKAGQVAPAETLQRKMQEIGYDLDGAALGQLIALYGKRGEYEVVKKLLESHSVRSKFVFNSTVGALLNCNKVEAAAEFVEKARDAGVRLNEVVVSMLLNAYSKAGMLERVDTLIVRAKHDAIELDTVAFNMIIKAQLRAGRFEKAMDTFSELLDLRLRPSAHTYGIMISVFAKAGRIKDAEKIFSDMKSSGIQPDEKLYSHMINCYAKAGVYEHAADLFQAMKLRGVKPNQVTYNNLIEAYARAGQPAQVEKLLLEMQQAGCSPCSITYLFLIRAYARKGSQIEAESVLQRMQKACVKPEKTHFHEVMLAFSRAGQPVEAMRIFSEMERLGVQPDSVAIRSIVKILFDASMTQEGLSICQRFQVHLGKHSGTQTL